MRTNILIVFLLFSLTNSGQGTAKQLSAWDSLFIKNEQVEQMFQERLKRELYNTDSVYVVDTIIVSYYSRDGLILQRISKHTKPSGCFGFRQQYYNEYGLLSLIKTFSADCPVTKDLREIFYAIPFYERFEYDSLKRPVVHVFDVSTPMTVKETFRYLEDGKIEIKRTKIDQTRFWD